MKSMVTLSGLVALILGRKVGNPVKIGNTDVGRKVGRTGLTIQG